MQFFVNSVPVCGDTVPLGVQGENLATQITADVSGWLDQWPDGQVIVRLIDANRQSHLADTVVNDGTLVWIVTAADTAQGGYGVGVVELVQGDVVKKSEPFATRVVTDPQASGQAPEPVPGWVEETIARMEELEAGAAQSAGAAQTSADAAQTGAQSAQTAAAQAAHSAEDAAAVLGQVEAAGAAQVSAVQAAGQQQTQAVTAAGTQQVSAVQTEGADQRAAIETAGAAQVNAIQAEGQTQQTAIQQKGADTLASIPADYTELSGDVTDLKSAMAQAEAALDEKAAAIHTSAGPAPIVSIPDAAAAPVYALTVGIEPVQDLHGYDSPWPAGGGKNLWPPFSDQTKSGVTLTAENGTVTLNGTATADAYFDIDVSISVANGTLLYLYAFNPVASVTRTTLFVITTAGNPQANMNVVNASATDAETADRTIRKLRLRAPSGETFTNFKLSPYLQIGGSAPTAFTPYSNICPITGWTGAKVTRTGKNLLPTQTIKKNGSIYYVGDENTWLFFKAGTYTASNVGTAAYMYWRKKGTTLNNIIHDNTKTNGTFTLTEDCEIRFWFYTNVADASFTDIQIELGSTATDYEPYQGSTYDITFPTEAGTVYGGTLDVTSGTLTVDRAMVDLGTLNWAGSGDTIFYSTTAITNFKTAATVADRTTGMLCSVYPFSSNPSYSTGMDDKSMLRGNSTTAAILVRDTSYATSANFKTAMSGVQLVYELATPITYTLTPQEIRTLLGTNNIWADAGTVDVDYRADTKLYIDVKIAAAIAAALNA